jgi:hypothetical protein
VDGVIVTQVDVCTEPTDVTRRTPVWVYAAGASDNRAYFDGSVADPAKRARCGCPCTAADKGSVSLTPLNSIITSGGENIYYCSTGYHGETRPAVSDGWLTADPLFDRVGTLPVASGGYEQCVAQDLPVVCRDPPVTSGSTSASATPTPTPTPTATPSRAASSSSSSSPAPSTSPSPSPSPSPSGIPAPLDTAVTGGIGGFGGSTTGSTVDAAQSSGDTDASSSSSTSWTPLAMGVTAGGAVAFVGLVVAIAKAARGASAPAPLPHAHAPANTTTSQRAVVFDGGVPMPSTVNAPASSSFDV